MEKIIFVYTSIFVAYNIFKWRKRKLKFLVLSSLMFAGLQIGLLLLCEQMYGILDNYWWMFAISFLSFEISQFISFTLMLMTGDEVLKHYRLPIWHKEYRHSVTIEEIVYDVKSTKRNYLYPQKNISGAASQLYQLLKIKGEAHDEIFRSHMFLSLILENITIEELQKVVLRELKNAGAIRIETNGDIDVIKYITDICITMYVANRMTGMPPKNDNGLFDLRSPYEKEMEWRRKL